MSVDTRLRAPRTRTGLAERDEDARELMDDLQGDLPGLLRTYRQFRVVNRLVAGWRRCYVRELRPRLSADRSTTLVDLGAGGGDVARALHRWARRDGLRLDVTAIDPDPRAIAFAAAADVQGAPAPTRPPVEGRPGPARVWYRCTDSSTLVAEGARFDLVVSNHVLHHLDRASLETWLADSERLARVAVLHNDLRRSRLAYVVFLLLTWPLARRSYLHTDGLISIRRSFRPAELRSRVPAGWRVRPAWPFRLHLWFEPGSRGATRD